MGIKLARRRFLLNRQFNYTRPLVFCCQVDGATDEAVSLNVPLAEQLARIEPDARSRRLEGCLVDCLAGQGYPDYRTYDINRYDITCIF